MCFKLANTQNEFWIINKLSLQLISFKVVVVSILKLSIIQCMNFMNVRETKFLLKVLFNTKNYLLSIKSKL